MVARSVHLPVLLVIGRTASSVLRLVLTESLHLLLLVEVPLLFSFVEPALHGLVNDTLKSLGLAVIHLDIVDVLLVDRTNIHVLVRIVLHLSSS